MVTQNHLNGQDKAQTTAQPVPPEPVTFTNGFEHNNVASSNNGNNLVQAGFANVPREDSHRAYLDNAAIAQTAPNRTKGPWKRLSLRTKATLLAIAIGTIPVLGIGATAYYFANQSITKQIKQEKQERATEIVDKVNRFMVEQYGNLKIMSAIPLLKNYKVRAVTTLQEKATLLDHFLEYFQVYDNIAAVDLNGNLIVQSHGYTFHNLSDRLYFQQTLQTGKPGIYGPERSKSTGEYVIYFAAPIIDTFSGKIIGVFRSRMPLKSLEKVIENFGTNGDRYHVFDSSKSYFLAKDKNDLGLNVLKDFPGVAHLMSGREKVANEVMSDSENHRRLVTYTALGKQEGLPDLNWGVLLSTETEIAFAPQRQLLLTLVIGTGVVALLVSSIAAYLARRATRPILAATSAVAKLGQGELDTRIAVAGEDELATLGSNINQMAEQIQTLLVEQGEAARQQLSAQTEIARQQTEFAEQQKQQNEALQRELLQLLGGVEAASDGDLTVRAEITAGEIGIVADFFNSIVESLRDVVLQVKHSTAKVNVSLGADEGAMRQLADESLKQAKEIERLLDSVETMSQSIQEVAANANQAATVARQASATAQAGGVAMDDTVQSILHLRETVAETAKKVKRLGESSQQISKVISLINQIALQTNLLAINASIEAARAGEEGRGFAVVAEEVGELAARSATATKEIEQIVEKIQLETNEVVFAMETGTAQVVEGTNLVANAKQSLEQIMQVSNQIDQLVQSISTATVSQASTSQSVTSLMKEIAEGSERTSEFSRQISGSLQQTVEVARQLQGSVDTFKVGAAT